MTTPSIRLYNINNMSVKNNLHTARKKAGLTQEELAHAGNISRQAYVSIESGKSVPSTEVALRIARKLHDQCGRPVFAG